MEDAADFAVFFDTEFGPAETIGYTLTAGGSHDVDGIYQDAHSNVLAGEFAGVSTTTPVFTTASTSLPTGAAVGDTVSRATSMDLFTVQDMQPDGTGLVRLILERQ